MLLMIDNYDSFTYNLVQYFGELGEKVMVFRNDEITPDEVTKLEPSFIVFLLAPCTLKDAIALLRPLRPSSRAYEPPPRRPS